MGNYSSVGLASQAAAAGDVTTAIGKVATFGSDNESVVRRVVVTPPPGYATVTGVATNNATISVRQLRAGSVLATFASLTLASGTNLVAETPVVIPITAAITPAEDDVFDVVLHQNGTGLLINAGLLVNVELD